VSAANVKLRNIAEEQMHPNFDGTLQTIWDTLFHVADKYIT
jgi:hypothetical protein